MQTASGCRSSSVPCYLDKSISSRALFASIKNNQIPLSVTHNVDHDSSVRHHFPNDISLFAVITSQNQPKHVNSLSSGHVLFESLGLKPNKPDPTLLSLPGERLITIMVDVFLGDLILNYSSSKGCWNNRRGLRKLDPVLVCLTPPKE